MTAVGPGPAKPGILRGFWISAPAPSAKLKENDCILCLRPLLKVARVFGAVPIYFKDSKMRFRWVSLLTAYAVVVACVLGAYVVTQTCLSAVGSSLHGGSSDPPLPGPANDSLANVSQGIREVIKPTMNSVNASTKKVTKNSKNQDVLGTVQAGSFFYFSLSGSILFIRAATMLAALCERWCAVEDGLGSDAPLGPRWPLFLVQILFGLSAAGENAMSMVYSQTDLPPFWEYLETYISNGYPEISELCEYSRPLGILLVVINKYATFIWNFVDVFISTLAYILMRHFKAFNQKLQKELQAPGNSVKGEAWWRRVREQHHAMQELVEATDAITGPLVLQSYMCNLYFMLMQLYNTLKPRGEMFLVRSIYLAWSFLHLLCRLLFVSFTCASLHSLTLAPTPLLLALPTESVQVEVRRFLQQLQVRQVGLTGWGFFFVNKNFILATTGALITYEVILLQFSPAPTTPA